MSEIQHTLILVKPDGVARGLVGEVLGRFEAKGYRLSALDLRVPTVDLLDAHYAEHLGKDWYPNLRTFMSGGLVASAVVSGVRVIDGVMALCGPTDPTAAPPGTIRGDLGCDVGNGSMTNVVHRSDAPESAAREVALWFPDLKLA